MQISKQHFELIAAVIRDERRALYQEMNHPLVGRTLDSIARRFAEHFERENPRFDRARFLAACGVK